MKTNKIVKHTEADKDGRWLVMGNMRNGHFDYVLPMSANEEFQANARLIAAAPKLLQACKIALSGAEPYPGYIKTMLSQAIAKAEGRDA